MPPTPSSPVNSPTCLSSRVHRGRSRCARIQNGGCVLVGSLEEAAADGEPVRARTPAGGRVRTLGPHRSCWTMLTEAGEILLGQDTPVQRGQLPHRLPCIAAHEWVRARLVGHHRRRVPEAHRDRRGSDPDGVAVDERGHHRARRSRRILRPRRGAAPAPYRSSASTQIRTSIGSSAYDRVNGMSSLLLVEDDERISQPLVQHARRPRASQVRHVDAGEPALAAVAEEVPGSRPARSQPARHRRTRRVPPAARQRTRACRS